jgi:hypothetical protein
MEKPQDQGHRTYSIARAKREQGLGPGSAGQSGDTQGLSGEAEAGSESVLELVEEGQSFEAEAVAGVEDAPDADVAEVHTKEVPEDDVPSEYLGKDD